LWFNFRLKPIYNTSLAGFKNDAQFKSGQNWHKIKSKSLTHSVECSAKLFLKLYYDTTRLSYLSTWLWSNSISSKSLVTSFFKYTVFAVLVTLGFDFLWNKKWLKTQFIEKKKFPFLKLTRFASFPRNLFWRNRRKHQRQKSSIKIRNWHY